MKPFCFGVSWLGLNDVAGVAAALPFGCVWPKLNVVDGLKPFCGCEPNPDPKLVVAPFCVFPNPPNVGVLPFGCSGAGAPNPFDCVWPWPKDGAGVEPGMLKLKPFVEGGG